ncbi:hypothetical protein PVAG01_08356 [Phlyctema vagabunda]|uniref:Glycosyltransferase family 31 protein n=1 Tax=Phlyctema vagabunda TaxID=108571 RepID=A0ABR4P978_9HELO
MRRTRVGTPWTRWLVCAVLVLLLFYFHPSYSGIRSSRHLAPVPQQDLAYLQQVLKDHGVGPQINYAARHIQYRDTADERLALTEIDQPLFPNPAVQLNLDQATTLPPTLPPIEVPITNSPTPDRVDASSLIFGVSTTFSRFNDEAAGPVKEWARWLTDGKGNSNGATLVLCLHEATEDQFAAARSKLAEVGIDATVQASDSSLDMPGRYLALVPALYNHSSRTTRKYFALIDDDTFFPSISALVSTLSKYNPTKPYYIGAFTERVDWIMDHKVPMAYGGGGVFLTAPLAKDLVDLAPTCLKKDEGSGKYLEWGEQGDLLLYNCLHNHTETTLTFMPQLHQMDQWGDSSGFYESGQLPLSLHHYKSWHHLAPERVHLVADACGLDCVLQRFQFKDNWIISNGYSVAEYPQGINFDIMQMEGTFDNGFGKDGREDVSLSYSFGPLRKSLARTGRKRSWELLDAKSDGGGRVTQVYVKKRDDERWLAPGESKPENDEVVVLVWRP